LSGDNLVPNGLSTIRIAHMFPEVAQEQYRRQRTMKSLPTTGFVLALAICAIAFSASHRTALAESLEV
jgi:hypothetical protein